MSQRSSRAGHAASIGREHGRDAAAWVFNGSTGADLRQDDFIGGDCEPADCAPCEEGSWDAAAAYQEAAGEAFWGELERLCRNYLIDAG